MKLYTETRIYKSVIMHGRIGCATTETTTTTLH